SVQPEDPLQHQADEEELHHGADGGQEQATPQTQAQERGDRPVDEDQQGSKADLEVRELEITWLHVDAPVRAERPPSTRGVPRPGASGRGRESSRRELGQCLADPSITPWWVARRSSRNSSPTRYPRYRGRRSGRGAIPARRGPR